MKNEIDWLPILIRCRDNVKKRITPLFETEGRQQQQSLGIGAGGDPIQQIDIEAEKAIVETLVGQGISFTLISEESGISEYGENSDENYVTIDPIDGTTNLTRGIPFYATSIAVSTKPALDAVHTALVADLFHGTTYTAKKNEGACCNNRKMAPSKQTALEDAVVGIDLNTYKAREIAPRLTNLIEKTKHIRHLGANALELCYVAGGITDAFIDIRGKLRTTDTAAACLIIKEAGALITTLDGKPLITKLHPMEKITFVASANPEIHEKILSLIKNG